MRHTFWTTTNNTNEGLTIICSPKSEKLTTSTAIALDVCSANHVQNDSRICDAPSHSDEHFESRRLRSCLESRICFFHLAERILCHDQSAIKFMPFPFHSPCVISSPAGILPAANNFSNIGVVTVSTSLVVNEIFAPHNFSIFSTQLFPCTPTFAIVPPAPPNPAPSPTSPAHPQPQSPYPHPPHPSTP